jgi:catechol 2,3-dioxygenase-like lactoylglutathione lyase family enzyme
VTCEGKALGLSVCQVAFSVLDLDGTMAWYRDILGFVDSGHDFGRGGPDVAAMQGLPEARLDMAWLVDRQDFFQLEFFRYTAPPTRPRRHATDELGYSSIGVVVDDFDAVISRLDRRTTPGDELVVIGRPGRRRTLVRDPNDVLVEIAERDQRNPSGGLPAGLRPEIRVAARSLRVVVADLPNARNLFLSLGAVPAPTGILGAEHEVLWNRPQNRTEVAALWAGDFLIELECPHGGGTPRQPGDYRISDQGILNIALGSRAVVDYAAAVEALGDRVRSHPETHVGSAVVRYLTSDQNLSVEVLAIPDPAIERAAGFVPQFSIRP